MSHKLVVAAAAELLVCLPPDARGHAERPSFFPDPGLGEVPAYRTSGPSLVVCKRDSRRRIQRELAGAARRRNLRLLPRCGVHHIQPSYEYQRRCPNAHNLIAIIRNRR